MHIVDIYLNEVKRELFKLTPADDFLNELKNNLLDFTDDNPDCSMDDLIEQFGKPEDLAREFLDSAIDCSPKAISKKNKKKKIIIIVLCIALIIAAIYCIRLSMQTQSKATDVITIYEESVSDNEPSGDQR